MKTSEAARLRPATTAALWARCFACRPGHRLSREHGQLSLHCVPRNCPDSLTKPDWLETSASGCDPAVEPALSPYGVARSDLRSAAEDSDVGLRARATAPGIESSSPGSRPSATRWVGMNDRRGLRCSCLRSCGLALRTGNSDNTHCAFVPSCLGHYFILIAPTILTREPLWAGIKLRTMWRCLPCRCGAVTATAG